MEQMRSSGRSTGSCRGGILLPGGLVGGVGSTCRGRIGEVGSWVVRLDPVVLLRLSEARGGGRSRAKEVGRRSGTETAALRGGGPAAKEPASGVLRGRAKRTGRSGVATEQSAAGVFDQWLALLVIVK